MAVRPILGAMSRTSYLLVVCSCVLVGAPGCGAKDTLSPDSPVEAGAAGAAGTGGASFDAAVQDHATADQHIPPPQEAGPDVAPPPPDAQPIYDGAVPDTGVHTTKSCAAQGGALCTNARWELCPIGFEPIAAGDGHFNCGMTHDGWCCVAAPTSSCTMSGVANCVVNACTDCFAPAPDKSLTCEPGRACCVDMCN
ncbi:MAG: hypothetical protein HY898_08360 [Deltaproteobacteria bacterium]|nr:hypothetical protein [Deltaproteobacteria bacterium]